MGFGQAKLVVLPSQTTSKSVEAKEDMCGGSCCVCV